MGLYEVAFDLSGFRPAQRQAVRLTVGFIAKVDVALGLASVAETITVSGASPLVDVAATSGNTLLTREMLELTATSRNSIMSVLTLAPGVRSFLDVGGGQMMLENPAARAYGVGGMTSYTIDGVQNFRLGSTFWDYQTFDEVRVQTTGVDADRPTKGVQVSAVVKSGGNEFHGNGFYAATNKNFQGSNLDQELEAIGITSGDALDNQYDVSGDLGGRIIRNKLWFYSAARKRHAAYDVLNVFQPDGSPGQTINDQRIITNKVSYQANAANRFIFMNMWEHGDEQKGLNELVAYESREFKTNDRPHTKIEWQGVRGNTFIANLQFGHSRQLGDSPFLNTPQIVGRSDLETERVTGDNLVFGETSVARAYHTTGNVSWYKPNWAGGNHEFKGGFDYGDVKNAYPGMTIKDINYHLQYSRRGAHSGGLLQRAGPATSGSQPVWRVLQRQLDHRASTDAESRASLRPRGSGYARDVPRNRVRSLGRHLPRPVLRRGAAPQLELRGPAPVCLVRSLGGWQDRGEGRVGTLRQHARHRRRHTVSTGIPSRTASIIGAT